MDPKISRGRPLIALFLVMVVSLVWMACSSTVKETRTEPAVPNGQSTSDQPITPEQKEVRYKAKYYQFDDVLVPDELSFDPKNSFVYETPRFKTGILYFSKWRLDVDSVVDFFTSHMERDNWKMVNSYRGKESVLNFSKPDKTCSIKISENWVGTTYVEIRVGPLGIGEKKM